MNELIIGIDLGTTYSCVACIDEFGKPVVLKNQDNESTTPSVVAFVPGEDQVLVGQIAKDQKEYVSKEFVVDFIKREMGDPNWRKEINGKVYTPQEISSIILRKLVADAAASLGKEITKVVVTHPAYYDIPQKSAVIEAGQIAGLSGYFSEKGANAGYIPINLIPEPTAAAYYYGVKHQDQDETVLVYDLGGGTFDVTLLKISKTGIEALCVGGDHRLGGKDWDDEIVRYCLASSGLDEQEFANDSTALGMLQLRVEKAKKFLSTKQSAPINFTYLGNTYRTELSLEDFNNMTSHKLEETINLCNDTMKRAAELGYTQHDRILLVGGSTRMKQVQERLKEVFPNIPIEFHEPDEAVAKGAAVYANLLMYDEVLRQEFIKRFGREFDKNSAEDVQQATLDPKLNEQVIQLTGKPVEEVIEKTKMKLTNITGKAFGIKCLTASGEKFKSIIPSQSKLPAENTESFGTVDDNQSNALIAVMETDLNTEFTELENCTKVAEEALSLPAGLPKNSEIKVTFMINEQGLLSYRALHEPSNNKIEGSVSVVGSMTQQEIEEAARHQNSLQYQ
ncbi:MAG: Hsp70 family protein [Candidatus Cloacimonas sp.]|jgi:molecular chaperone DnaK (HSP70)|nr:Hsp70 family protein [Candidatus Cloacimonas sp.]